MSDKNYESLPDLMKDLEKMVDGINTPMELRREDIAFIQEKFDWVADIKCGGNYHTIIFKTIGNSFYDDHMLENRKSSDDIKKNSQGFADFNCLHAELEYMRQFILTSELNEQYSMNLQYTIVADSDMPHLAVRLYGNNKKLLLEQEQKNLKFDKEINNTGYFKKLYNKVMPVITLAVAIPIIVIPTVYIVKKMNE